MGNCPLEACNRPHPRLSPCKPSCRVSQQPGVARLPKCPRPAQLVVLCPEGLGSRFGGTRPALATGPSPGSRWCGRRPNPERPGRLPQPHPAALARPSPPPWRLSLPAGGSWQVQSRSPPAPRPAYTIAQPPAGDRALYTPYAPAPRRLPWTSPRALGALRTRGDPGESRTAGWGGTARGGRSSVAWASPQGP